MAKTSLPARRRVSDEGEDPVRAGVLGGSSARAVEARGRAKGRRATSGAVDGLAPRVCVAGAIAINFAWRGQVRPGPPPRLPPSAVRLAPSARVSPHRHRRQRLCLRGTRGTRHRRSDVPSVARCRTSRSPRARRRRRSRTRAHATDRVPRSPSFLRERVELEHADRAVPHDRARGQHADLQRGDRGRRPMSNQVVGDVSGLQLDPRGRELAFSRRRRRGSAPCPKLVEDGLARQQGPALRATCRCARRRPR